MVVTSPLLDNHSSKLVNGVGGELVDDCQRSVDKNNDKRRENREHTHGRLLDHNKQSARSTFSSW